MPTVNEKKTTSLFLEILFSYKYWIYYIWETLINIVVIVILITINFFCLCVYPFCHFIFPSKNMFVGF